MAVGGVRVGVNICEDIWEPWGPTIVAAQEGDATLVINLSMSPYHVGKGKEREAMLAERARDAGCYVCYVNGVGGQDELVFDGQSLVFGPNGDLVARAKQFEEDLLIVDLDVESVVPKASGVPNSPESDRPLPRWGIEVMQCRGAARAADRRPARRRPARAAADRQRPPPRRPPLRRRSTAAPSPTA